MFRTRLGGYLSIVLLIGLVGGLAMGAIAAARRTLSSYPTFLASTNPSDITISGGSPTGGPGSQSSSSTGPYSDAVRRYITRIPGVRHVEVGAFINAAPLAPDGAPELGEIANLGTITSIDGLLLDQDRVGVIAGRIANPHNPDEVMLDAGAARLLHARVGETIPIGAYSGAQTSKPQFGTPKVHPSVRIEAKIVGIVALSGQIVQDDIDQYPYFMIFTPAFGDRVRGIINGAVYGVELNKNESVSAFEREFTGHPPPEFFYQFHVTANVTSKVQSSVRPEAIAIGIFGLIIAVAALLIGLQIIARQLRSEEEDLRILRSLGADPAAVMFDTLIGVFASIGTGALLALGVAVALSPLSPLGPVRPVYPGGGVAADWTALGLGIAVLVVGLGGGALALAYRRAPHRITRRAESLSRRHSKTVSLAAASGLSASGVVGVHFALEPGRGRTSVPVRSVILGAVLAVMTVVATLTFGSGLQTLISHPRLYGWNWNYALTSSNDVPPQTLALLARDRDVVASTGVSFAEAKIDGIGIPIVTGDSHPELSPPILAGHGVEGRYQIVFGAATLALLHQHLGGAVELSYGSPSNYPAYIPPTRLTIVGVATMPAMGYPSFVQDHPSMGTGAVVSNALAPLSFQNASKYPDPVLNGPSTAYVRLRSGVSATAGFNDMQRIKRAADAVFARDPNTVGTTLSILGVQRPAQIVNYRSMGATPVVLAVGLAVGAIVALGLTLTASVRRRRRDLALLKTLGFTRRGLAGTVAWQSSCVAVIAVVIGMPLGIVLGRQLWILFANNIDAVPEPTIPTLSLLAVAVGAVVFANVVAAIPGRIAARTPAALVLRSE